MGVHRLHAENAKKLLDRTRTEFNDAILIYCTSENKMAAASVWTAVSAYRHELPEKFYSSILSLHFCLTKVKLLPPALANVQLNVVFIELIEWWTTRFQAMYFPVYKDLDIIWSIFNQETGISNK